MLTTTETSEVQYFIEAPGVGYHHNGTVSASNEVILYLPKSIEVRSHNQQNKGIYLTASSKKVTVIGQALDIASSDSFLALPITILDNAVYVYYGISVTKTVAFNSPHYSSVLIVGTENNTIMKLTVTQSIDISVCNTTTNLIPNKVYAFVINRLQTFYIRSFEDLTGTKIATDKPVSVISGHGCGNVHQNFGFCSHSIEQIPPTTLWGKVYYTAPLASKRLYTIKMLAAHNFTTVNIYCNNAMELYTINEGKFVYKTLQKQEYCAIYSNKKILVARFSHGVTEYNNNGDPMMIIVPAINQYLNRFDFSTIRNPLESRYNHYINIIVMAQYFQPNMMYLTEGGVNKSLVTQQWVPVQVNNITKAYATQVKILEGITEIFHSNPAARLMVIVYGFTRYNGYGHIGGKRLLNY